MKHEHDLFRGPKLKVEWADHHVHTLKDTLNAFMQTDFYRVHIEEDPNSWLSTLEFETLQEPPSEIPLIIGDIVHNLRSALDLAMCEIVEGFSGTLHRHTHFPIRETREEVVRAVDNGAINGAPTDLITLLIECIRPYKGGNDSLWTLHDLDILDKHRMIVPVFSFSPLIVTEEGSTQPMAFGQSFLPKLRRGEVHKERVLPNMKFKDNYKPVIFVFLDDITCGFPREDVFGTLRRLERGVIDTIEALAREYATLRREGVIEKAPKDLVI